MAGEDWFNDIGGFLNAIVGTGADAVSILGDLIASMAKAADTVTSFSNSNQFMLVGLEKQVALNRELSKAYKDLVKNTLFLEQRNKQINKSFGVGVKQAAQLSQKFQQVATDLGIAGVQTAKYGGSIKKMLPTLNQITSAGKDFYTGMQQTQHILQTNIKLTEDQANAYTQYAMQNGENAGQMMKATQALVNHLDPDGTMGYFKMITEEIAETSNEVQLQYGKIPGNLEMAVLKAKKLGFSLEDLASTGNDLLEIESSIGNELEYQLLSGHRLVDNQGNSLTNLYREATIRGDMNQQADIMNKILEDEGDVLENNMFARKQMAQMLGMEEQQLASALQKKKILEKASAAGVKINLDGEGAMNEAAKALEAGAITQDEFDALKDATDTRTTDEILDQILKVNEEQNMIGILSYKQMEAIASSQGSVLAGGKAMGGSFLNLDEDQLTTLGTALQSSRTLATTTSGLDAEAETSEVTSIYGGDSGLDMNDDAVITPGYGKRVLSFPEDTLQPSIAFNDKDYIMASTNSPLASSGGGADISQLAAVIVAAINNQTRALTSQTGGGLNAPMYAS
jgi:hypothetical protein